MSIKPPPVVPPASPAAAPAAGLPEGTADAAGKTMALNPVAPRTSVWGTVVTWAVLLALGGAAWHYQANWLPLLEPLMARSKPPAARPPRIVPVSTAVVRQRDLPLYLNGLGTVTAFRTVTLRSRVEGELVKVAFTEGQMVREGDLLAEIDPRPFEVQLSQAESQLARDQAFLKSAKSTLSRYEGLLASKSITAQEVEDQATVVLQTMASVQADEATIATAKLQLTYCRIVAPIAGRIGLRLVDEGNIVAANDPGGLAVITQLQPIALVFTIPQDEIARVQRQSQGSAPLRVEAYDRDFKDRLAIGRLVAIDNQVDATTGTVRLKSEFDNQDGLLFPNQFVNARLLVDTKRDAIVVPSAAVQRGPASMYVYVVKSDDTVELRSVVPGPSEGTETSIETGLAPGEIVVTDGLDKLQPGAKVAPRDKSNARSGGDAPPASGNGAPGGTKPGAAAPEPRGTTAGKVQGQTAADAAPAADGETRPKTAPSCEQFDPGSNSKEDAS